MAIIRDMQFDPVSENLIHVDLQEVAMDRAIRSRSPSTTWARRSGVKDTQGILEMVLREVRVSCLPGNIPEYLEADVTNLAIHDVLTVEGPEGPRGRARPERSQPGGRDGGPAGGRGSRGGRRGADEATAAEPEVLTERKPKEEAARGDDKKPEAEKKK